MTSEEKKAIVQEVIAEIKNTSGNKVQDATVEQRINMLDYILALSSEAGSPMRKFPAANIETKFNVVWDESSNINTYTTAGVYNIKGQRTMSSNEDNLPITNRGGGHTIHARLLVLDSSIESEINSDDKCITQILSMSNRVGGDGNVYIRTGRGYYKNGITWENWATLQTNVNVDQVDSLDTLIDNGIYSGVWTSGFGGYPITFVCVVINDYFLKTDNNSYDRKISQFMYGLHALDGNTFYKTRSWADSKAKWSDWKDINEDNTKALINDELSKLLEGTDPDKVDSLKDLVAWVEEHSGEASKMASAIEKNTTDINAEVTRAKAEEAELLKRLQGTSSNMGNGANYPFVYISKSLNDLTGGALHTYLNEFTPYTSNNKVYNTGIYRIGSIGGSSFITVTNHSFNWDTYIYVQVVEGPVAITSEGLATVQYNTYGKYYRYSSKGSDGNLVWKAWKSIDEANTDTAIQNKVGILNKAYPNSNAEDNGAKELPFPIKAGDIVSIIGPEGWDWGFLYFDANGGDYSKYVTLTSTSMKDGKLLNYKIPTGKGNYVTHCKFLGHRDVWRNATFSFFYGDDTLSEVVHDNYDQLSARIEMLEQQIAKLTTVQ